jgi:hypothetical protein
MLPRTPKQVQLQNSVATFLLQKGKKQLLVVATVMTRTATQLADRQDHESLHFAGMPRNSGLRRGTADEEYARSKG